MKHSQKLLCAVLLLVNSYTGLFAEKNEGPNINTKEEVPQTMFIPMFTILGVYLPNSDMMDVKIPYFMPMVHGRFTHRFTLYGKNPQVEFHANGELSPLWFKASSHFEFKPISAFSISAGGSIETSWGVDLECMSLDFISLDFIGKYNKTKRKYETYTPLSHWVYTGWIQAAFNYDIGSLITSGKQHIVFNGAYRAKYSGMTGVENGEVWMNQGQGEQTNGFSYIASSSLNYIFPYKYLKSIGLSGKASGYFSDSFFDEEYRICDPTFVDLTFALTASANIGYKNRFMLMLPVSGIRNFECEPDENPLTKPNGRKWQCDGVILTYTHIF